MVVAAAVVCDSVKDAVVTSDVHDSVAAVAAPVVAAVSDVVSHSV